MENLKFKPKIYRITIKDYFGNTVKYDLLTVDGEDPASTVYYYKKNDIPSSDAIDAINVALENKEWEEINIHYKDIKIFDIDIKTLETIGEGYKDIVKKIKMYI